MYLSSERPITNDVHVEDKVCWWVGPESCISAGGLEVEGNRDHPFASSAHSVQARDRSSVGQCFSRSYGDKACLFDLLCEESVRMSPPADHFADAVEPEIDGLSQNSTQVLVDDICRSRARFFVRLSSVPESTKATSELPKSPSSSVGACLDKFRELDDSHSSQRRCIYTKAAP